MSPYCHENCSKVAIVGTKQWMDHIRISNTVDSTGALRVVGVATAVLSSCSSF